jgi:hypothetical protein
MCCEKGDGGIFLVHESEKIGGGFLIWECGGEWVIVDKICMLWSVCAF